MAQQKSTTQQAQVVEVPSTPQVAYVKQETVTAGKIVGGFVELLGLVVGIAAGGFVWVKLAEKLPAGVTVVQKIGRYVLLSAASVTTEYVVSEAITKTYDESVKTFREIIATQRASRSLVGEVAKVQQ